MESTEQLVKEITALKEKVSLLTKQYSYPHAFWSGILAGFGSVIGATLVVAAILWILGQLSVVPVIGSWLAEIIKIVQVKLGH